MNAPAVHRVRRLSWQARAPAPGQAFALRTLLQEQGDAVQALLDRVLDGVVPPGTVLRLPRLDLAVRAGSVDELERELLPQLEAALRRALADVRVDAAVDAPSARVQHVSAATAARDALRRYLAQGDLPWPQQSLPPEVQRAELAQAAERALEEVLAAAARVTALLPAEAARWPGALARWLALLAAARRVAWIEAVAAALPSTRRAIALASAAVLVQAQAGDIETPALWLALAVAAASEPSQPPPAMWRLPAGAPAGARAALGPLLPAAPPVIPEPVPAPALRARAQALPPVAAAPLPAPDTAATTLVPLAGLVLLHPYLPRLLRGCGLVVDDHIPDEHRPRACTLLHALATGEPEAPEYALPFVKLLLGQAPDEPLPAPPPALMDDDRGEIDALLAAVREHWPALRGTAAQGLRVSFLQRRGLLERRDGAWQLRLQREPFDLLLGLLPWGIAFVKLPWMRQPLVVEWPAS